MKMKRLALAAVVLGAMTTATLAQPVVLSDAQMEVVTAAGYVSDSYRGRGYGGYGGDSYLRKGYGGYGDDGYRRKGHGGDKQTNYANVNQYAYNYAPAVAVAVGPYSYANAYSHAVAANVSTIYQSNY